LTLSAPNVRVTLSYQYIDLLGPDLQRIGDERHSRCPSDVEALHTVKHRTSKYDIVCLRVFTCVYVCLRA